MHIKGTETTLVNEEKRTVKWFLSLFYFISIGYDLCYYYIFPKYVFHTDKGNVSKLGFGIYVLMFALLPLALYLVKHGKQSLVKYAYFISYIIITLADDLVTYLGSSLHYASGNVVEVFFILFSPIFVNRKYFWLTSLGTITKYIIIGLILSTTNAFAPIIFVIVFAIVAYIFLNRFTGHVRAIEDSFDKQLQGIVKGVIATLELKDPYTRGHSERVAYYALALAKEMGGFSSSELKEFNYACLLHDVGKIHVPDQILMKPQELTDEEYEVIKTHPSVGAEAMAGVEGLKNGIKVIRSHHERWDGKGYPDQLAEECIPLLARITSIADAFDAMTSSRSYREAMPLPKAYQIIIEGKGTQFDPNLVETFEKVYSQWVDFHQKYQWGKK
ncbi:HD-GYP domain-containing protein [Bacillus sp. 1NLA3E]|uniref:HD-GYP domain-containing protein n=1 Tax=Bacillus sp. 1NLA3E TaxID=666686 RepID=UPI000247E7B9|nr:HD-GYP domain-containing protein [Bacillus sp. 1NLA3E]AGK52221.1 HD-GYP domain protein [Bacillus sp. 1NLA3E]